MLRWSKMERSSSLHGSVRTVDTHTKAGKVARLIALEGRGCTSPLVLCFPFINATKIAACIVTPVGSMLTVRC